MKDTTENNRSILSARQKCSRSLDDLFIEASYAVLHIPCVIKKSHSISNSLHHIGQQYMQLKTNSSTCSLSHSDVEEVGSVVGINPLQHSGICLFPSKSCLFNIWNCTFLVLQPFRCRISVCHSALLLTLQPMNSDSAGFSQDSQSRIMR